MIDLDDQLAAYANYLADTEQSVTVLHPRPIRTGASPARWAAVAAAAVLVIGGSIGVATLRSDDDATGGTDSEWTVVPDPDGVFVPPPGTAEVHSGDSYQTESNRISVRSIEAVSDGFVAVGVEQQGFAPVGAVWRSSDGVDWSRVHDPSFGALGFSEDPVADGPSMIGVAERNGRTVIAGTLSQTGGPAVWVTDDWQTWDVIEIKQPDEDTQPMAVASGPDGFVMVGIDYGAGQDVHDAGVVWFSPDGESWALTTLEDSWGARLHDVVHTDRGWLASGSIGSAAAMWSSTDGLTWAREDVEQTPDERLQFTSIEHLVEFDGRIYGYGPAQTSGNVNIESTASAPDVYRVIGTAQPAVWIEDGRSWSAASPVAYDDATMRSPSVMVATDDTLIALGQEFTGDHMVTFEMRSSNGVLWERIPNSLPGLRTAAATRDGVAVAAGFADDFVPVNVGPPIPGQSTGPTGAATIWILGT